MQSPLSRCVRSARALHLSIVGASAAIAITSTASAQSVPLSRVSVSSSEAQGNAQSLEPAFSRDGRFIVFDSLANNLVASDANGLTDVFSRDTLTGTTKLVSYAYDGSQGNGYSAYPSTSADGRYVSFRSYASNLVPGDTNGYFDIFVRDTVSNTTTIESAGPGGVPGNVYATYAQLSDDGQRIAFHSYSSNLVPVDSNGMVGDVFLRNRTTGTTVLACVSSAGVQGNAESFDSAISGDGAIVGFGSVANNLVIGDTNAKFDVFLRNTLTSTTTRVSLNSLGAQGNGDSRAPSLSINGQFVAFESEATNFVPGDFNGVNDIFVRDTAFGTTVRASVSSLGVEGDGESRHPVLSSNGRFVVFQSDATNLVPNDTNGVTDIFKHDVVTGITTLIDVSGAGHATPPGQYSQWPTMSGDARFVAFDSDAPNLIALDSNGVSDVFVRDTSLPTASSYCTAKTSSIGCVPSINSTGEPSATAAVPFTIGATNILSHKSGLLIYSHSSAATPYQGGVLCIGGPIKRTGVQDSNGNFPPTDCTGTFAYDFNARIQSGADVSLVVGAQIFCQYWYRDPADAFGSGLSDGEQFIIAY